MSKSFWIGFAAWQEVRPGLQRTPSWCEKSSNAYVNELLQVIVQVGQVILSSLVISNELLFALQKLLALLFEGFTFRSFVVDASHHEGIFVVVLMFGLLGEEFFNGDERQLLVLVAGNC